MDSRQENELPETELPETELSEAELSETELSETEIVVERNCYEIPAKPFRFLDLPRETRDLVYGWVQSDALDDGWFLSWSMDGSDYDPDTAIFDLMLANRQVLDEFMAVMCRRKDWSTMGRIVNCFEAPQDVHSQYDVMDPISIMQLHRGTLLRDIYFKHSQRLYVHCAVSRGITGHPIFDRGLEYRRYPWNFDFYGKGKVGRIKLPERPRFTEGIPDAWVRSAIGFDKLHIVDWILEKVENSEKLNDLRVTLDIAAPFDLQWIMEQVVPLQALSALKEILVAVGPWVLNPDPFISWKAEKDKDGSWTWKEVPREILESSGWDW